MQFSQLNKIDTEIVLLLKEFSLKKQFLAQLLSAYSQFNILRERAGTCRFVHTEFAYLFHGIGCLITYRGEDLNFDLLFDNGFNGRIDGFRLNDIELYCESIKRTDLCSAFKNTLDDLIDKGIVVRSREAKDTLYLKEDYINLTPFVPDFKWTRIGSLNTEPEF